MLKREGSWGSLVFTNSFNYNNNVKFLVLILTILFSYSVFADCCNTPEFEENCQIEALKESACSDVEHSSKDHDVSHCSFGCSSKIIKKSAVISIPSNFIVIVDFCRIEQNFQGITVGPALRPPIA